MLSLTIVHHESTMASIIIKLLLDNHQHFINPITLFFLIFSSEEVEVSGLNSRSF